MIRISQWVAMAAVVALAGAVREWHCVCNPRECEVLEPSGCPGLGIMVLDSCGEITSRCHSHLNSHKEKIYRGDRSTDYVMFTKSQLRRCCKVCARTLGEDCGGFSGTCEPGLKCFEGSCTPIT